MGHDAYDEAVANRRYNDPCLTMPPPRKTKPRRYISHAEWNDDVFTAADGSHVSTDSHFTLEEAEGVTRMLRFLGFGGERRRFPIKTWITEE